MGSFDTTCAVSGLGISPGEPVRYGLLSACPYTDQQVCSIKDLWFPRVWPLRAVYADYGRPGEWTKGPTGEGAWLDAFHFDLVERGWGNNTYHEPPTNKGWTFEQMQEAVWERRVRVRSDVDRINLDKALRGEERRPLGDFFPKQPIPKGVPTRRRVEKLLKAAGLKLFAGEDGKRSGLVVQHRHYGKVRVQLESPYGKQAPLLKAEQVLREHYATMLTKGPINEGTSLIVCPKPDVDDYHYSDRSTKEPFLSVAQYFVREDVWTALTRRTIDGSWWNAKKRKSVDLKLSVATYREAAQEVWDTLDKDPMLVWGLESQDGTSWFAADAVPSTVGLGAAFKIVHHAVRTGGAADAKAVDAFLQEAAEFAFLQRVLMPTRFYWKPSYICGPQSTEWDEHVRFLGILKKVASARLKDDIEERKKWE